MPPISKKELETRVIVTRKLMSEFQYKSDIKRKLCDHFGVCARTAERYMRLARAEIQEELATSPAERKADALSMYRDLYKRAIDAGNLGVAKGVLERVDKILGNEEPIVVHTEGKSEVTVKERIRNLVAEHRPEMRRALESIADRAGEDFVRSLSSKNSGCDGTGRKRSGDDG